MIRATIKDVLQDGWDLPGSQDRGEDVDAYEHLYVVSNTLLPATVLYVGQSASPVTRLWEHMGLTGSIRDGSALGKLIREQQPDSLDWHVLFLSVRDCAPIVYALWPYYQRVDSGKAEEVAESSGKYPSI